MTLKDDDSFNFVALMGMAQTLMSYLFDPVISMGISRDSIKKAVYHIN